MWVSTVTLSNQKTEVYQKLPLLPTDLDIILLKPASGSENDNRAINQRLTQIFRVQRRKIKVWLDYLQVVVVAAFFWLFFFCGISLTLCGAGAP